MKKYCILMLACMGFALFNESCSKDNAVINNSNEQITGNWELRVVTGGLTGGNTNYPPGNGNILSFTQGGGYTEYRSDTVAASGTYRIVTDTISGTGMPGQLLIVNTGTETTMPITFSLDTLVINHGLIAADGFITSYVKLAD